jgi:hypothetical protein
MHKVGMAVALAMGLTFAMPITPLSAQTASSDIRLHRRPPLRLEVRPQPRYRRQCTDWYAIEHRITGDVITPQYRCQWVLRP